MISINTDNTNIANKFEQAKIELAKNVKKVFGYDKPVLIEGSRYLGIWHECGPMESLIYSCINKDVAQNGIEIFFDLQKSDGYIPCYITGDKIGDAHIQIVVPIASTAYELYLLNKDKEFLKKAYYACVGFDEWISKYRDSKKSGAMELFCEYDTGQDGSNRFIGIPKLCEDVRTCPSVECLPFIAPDLTATRYGSRISLSKIALELGIDKEAILWIKKAEQTKNALMKFCFDQKYCCFYDRKSDGTFNKILCDIISIVMSEHVVSQELFDEIFSKYIYNNSHFWAEYPMTSVSLSDERFDGNFPVNSWSGASQALTALRTPRWFDYYGKNDMLRELMEIWIGAINNSEKFMQQMNSHTGEFSTSPDYSPSMLVYLDFIARLYGIVFDGTKVVWNAYLPKDTDYFEFKYEQFGICASLETNQSGFTATLNGKIVYQSKGKRTIATDVNGSILM